MTLSLQKQFLILFFFFIRKLPQLRLLFYLFISHAALSWLYPASHMITVEIGWGPLLTLKEMDGYCCALRDNDCKNPGIEGPAAQT